MGCIGTQYLGSFAIAHLFSEAVNQASSGVKYPITNQQTAECVICGHKLTKGKGRKVYVRINQRFPLERFWCKDCKGAVESEQAMWIGVGRLERVVDADAITKG